jgi:hypothetical protein
VHLFGNIRKESMDKMAKTLEIVPALRSLYHDMPIKRRSRVRFACPERSRRVLLFGGHINTTIWYINRCKMSTSKGWTLHNERHAYAAFATASMARFMFSASFKNSWLSIAGSMTTNFPIISFSDFASVICLRILS